VEVEVGNAGVGEGVMVGVRVGVGDGAVVAVGGTAVG